MVFWDENDNFRAGPKNARTVVGIIIQLLCGYWRTTQFNRHIFGNNSYIKRIFHSMWITSMASCQKGPNHHAYAWQLGPFWQDTLDMWKLVSKSEHGVGWGLIPLCHSFSQTKNKFFITWFCLCYKLGYPSTSHKWSRFLFSVINDWGNRCIHDAVSAISRFTMHSGDFLGLEKCRVGPFSWWHLAQPPDVL